MGIKGWSKISFFLCKSERKDAYVEKYPQEQVDPFLNRNEINKRMFITRCRVNVVNYAKEETGRTLWTSLQSKNTYEICTKTKPKYVYWI
jgi:hypothetical protein